jgi:Glycosyl hydrolase family 26
MHNGAGRVLAAALGLLVLLMAGAGETAGSAHADPERRARPVATGAATPDIWRADHSRSGLPWASGAWGENEPAEVEEWGRWRGRSSDVATWWVPRDSWESMTDFTPLSDSGFATYAVGIPPFPEGSGGSLGACAAGDYDRQWVDIAEGIRAAGIESKIVVRLGWEFNGDWYEWSAREPAAFAECWRRVFAAAESVAPGIHWAWNVSRGSSAGAGDEVLQAYPGDEFVDTIGVDSSDFYPAATDEQSWNEQLNGDHGLEFWLDFAHQHNTSLSFPEWGNVAGDQDEAGHDNPFYIRAMFEFFWLHADRIGFEAYFDTTESYWQSQLRGSTALPRSADAYRKFWSQRLPDATRQ